MGVIATPIRLCVRWPASPARIVGIVLFAIAVDFVLDGVREFVSTNSLTVFTALS